jgi:hypothetical protein
MLVSEPSNFLIQMIFKKCYKTCRELCSEFMYTWHMGRRWYTPDIDIITIDIKASRLLLRCRINVTCVYAEGDGLLQVRICCKLLVRYFLGVLKRCKSLGVMCGL